MALVRAAFDDLGDLPDRVPQLLVGVVVVRSEAEAGVGAEVADDLTLSELLVHGLEFGRSHGDGAAAAGCVTRAADVEAGVAAEVDEELRLPDGVLTDSVDADLLDQVVPGCRRVERWDIRR